MINDADIDKIASIIEHDEQGPFEASEASDTMARLLVSPQGVSVTDRNGETKVFQADSVVIQLPNGKTMTMDEVSNLLMGPRPGAR